MLTSDVQFHRDKLRINKLPTSDPNVASGPTLAPLTTSSFENVEAKAINKDVESHLDNSVKRLSQSVIKLKIRNLQSRSPIVTPDDVPVSDYSSMTPPLCSSIEEDSAGKSTMNPRQQKYYNLLAQVGKDRGYRIIGSYIDAHTKIKMQCPQKHDIEISPSDFKTGYGCAKCAGCCGVQSKEKLYTRAYHLGYEVLGTYISNHKKIQMQCSEKHYFEITPANFKSGHGCAQCAGKCPVQAKRQLYVQAQQRGFRVLGDYVDSGTKIQMQCSEEHLFEITPANFKSDHGCAQCTGQCPLQSRQDLYTQAEERCYTVLGIYTNNQTKIPMQCREQHLVDITPADFKSGRGCAKCAENCPIQAGDQFYAQAQYRGFRVIEPYVNNRIKVKMQCPEKHLFEIQPASFKDGHGCRVCTESAGEQLIRGLLTALELPFESQYVLPSLQIVSMILSLSSQKRRFL
jgi:hypothetical protein